MNTKILNNICMFFTNIKNSLPSIMKRIFTKKNISKIIIIFLVGLIIRIIISYCYNVNVFFEFFHKISLIYYSFMAIFIVVLNETFALFNFNIIPQFVLEYLISFQNIIKCINQLNSKILNLKSSDFNIKSVVFTIKNLVNYYQNDSNKLTIGSMKSNKMDKPFKLSYVLNKDEDKVTLPSQTYNPNQPSQSSTQNASNGSQVKPSISSSTVNSDKSVPLVFKGDINELSDM